jgi:hypothetical protein
MLVVLLLLLFTALVLVLAPIVLFRAEVVTLLVLLMLLVGPAFAEWGGDPKTKDPWKADKLSNICRQDTVQNIIWHAGELEPLPAQATSPEPMSHGRLSIQLATPSLYPTLSFSNASQPAIPK